VHEVPLEDGQPMTADLYRAVRDEELARFSVSLAGFRWDDAAELLDALVLDEAFDEFLTIAAYARLEAAP
jgi:malate synthase